MSENRFKNNFKGILITTLLVGTADIVAAILWYAVLNGQTTALKILQSVASGIFGRQAYRGGMQMAVAGLLLHYFITLVFVSFYFIVYPAAPVLRRHPLPSGVIYGLIIWMIMNLVVLPFTFGSLGTIDLTSAATSAAIIILSIGIPLAVITNKYYQN